MKISVIGLGHLGKIHLKLLEEISNENKEVTISGVYDINENMYENISHHQFNSIDEAVENSDATIIATSTSSHFDIAKIFITNGKHVFIEKPVTNSIQTAEDLLALESEYKVKVQIGHIERFNPAILAIAGYDIRPIFIESHRMSQFNPRGTDVSVVADLMIHDIDLILNLVNSPVTSIDANGAAIITDKIDIANARIKFENGCVANVTASRISQSKMRKMRIFQRSAYISIDFIQNSSEVFQIRDVNDRKESLLEIPLDDNRKIVYEKASVESTNPIKEELNSFINSIVNDTTPVVTLSQGVTALKVAANILAAVEESLNNLKI